MFDLYQLMFPDPDTLCDLISLRIYPPHCADFLHPRESKTCPDHPLSCVISLLEEDTRCFTLVSPSLSLFLEYKNIPWHSGFNRWKSVTLPKSRASMSRLELVSLQNVWDLRFLRFSTRAGTPPWFFEDSGLMLEWRVTVMLIWNSWLHDSKSEIHGFEIRIWNS